MAQDTTASTMDSSVRQDGSPHLLGLPGELQNNAVAFLTAPDVGSLVQTCKVLHDLHHYSLVPYTSEYISMVCMGDAKKGDMPRKGWELQLMLKQRIHSVCFQYSWSDEQAEQRVEKGRLFIAGEKMNGNGDGGPDTATLRLVYTSPVATNDDKLVSTWFSVRPNEKYFVWIHPGRGGPLQPCDMVCKTKFFCADDNDFSLRKNYSGLIDAGIIPIDRSRFQGSSFYRRLLRASIKDAIHKPASSDGEAIGVSSDPSDVLAHLQSSGLSCSLSGLNILREIFDEAVESAEISQTPQGVIIPFHAFGRGRTVMVVTEIAAVGSEAKVRSEEQMMLRLCAFGSIRREGVDATEEVGEDDENENQGEE